MTYDPSAVEQAALDRVGRDLPGLATAYREKFGNEIGTDNAREIVSPEYAASPEARTELSGATQKPAGLLSDYLFQQALEHPDPERPRRVVMTAGGTGAGKTTVLRNNSELAAGQFIYDSNLGSKKSSVAKIDRARAAANQVRVILVLRDPVEALTGGVLPRSMEEGRVVSLEAHARMYRDSAENFAYLTRKYATIRAYSLSPTTIRAGRDAPRSFPLSRQRKSAILLESFFRSCAPHWKTNMPKAELANQYIERLSALPPRKRLEAFRAISDPEVRRLVDEGLPPKLQAEMLAESGLENLNRNVLEDVQRRAKKTRNPAA